MKDWVGGKASVFKTLGASNHCDHERQKEHLWKPAYGEDLPKTDGWTIVLTECKAPWIAHNEEKPFYSVELARWSKYIKGWNTSDVKWWMDCLLPNLGED